MVGQDKKAEDNNIEQVYIGNAGLVLLNPFLPQLFSSLNLVENGKFLDEPSAEHAALLLQHVVNASTDTSEHVLALNKVLCGIRSPLPIQSTINVTADESELVEGMLQALIVHWSALGKTSVEGLRSSFLERSGLLQPKDSEWQLDVEARAFDMLLDQLPWTYQAIRLPWMTRVLHVNWR